MKGTSAVRPHLVFLLSSICNSFLFYSLLAHDLSSPCLPKGLFSTHVYKQSGVSDVLQLADASTHLSVHVELATSCTSIAASYIHDSRRNLLGDELELFLEDFSLWKHTFTLYLCKQEHRNSLRSNTGAPAQYSDIHL